MNFPPSPIFRPGTLAQAGSPLYPGGPNLLRHEQGYFVRQKTFSAADKVISVTDQGFSVPDNVKSVADQVFSLADKENPAPDQGYSLTDRVKSVRDEVKSAAEIVISAAEKVAGDLPNRMPRLRVLLGFSTAPRSKRPGPRDRREHGLQRLKRPDFASEPVNPNRPNSASKKR
jgi:hypothetical protein